MGSGLCDGVREGGQAAWADTGRPGPGCFLSVSSGWGVGDEGSVGAPGLECRTSLGKGLPGPEGRRAAEPRPLASAAAAGGRLPWLTDRPARLGVCR